MVDHKLLQLIYMSNSEPVVENIAALAECYLELKQLVEKTTG